MAATVSARRIDKNRLRPEDTSAHEWYRFVLSFPPHLVRDYVSRFKLTERSRVLDPFCGTGTTPVECKKLGIPSVGIEANPMAHYAARVKVNWSIDPQRLMSHAAKVARETRDRLSSIGIDDVALNGNVTHYDNLETLSPEAFKLLLTDCIRPLALHKALVLLEVIDGELRDEELLDHERLAFAKATVASVSNLAFGPEVGTDPRKVSEPVVASWLAEIQSMARDLAALSNRAQVEARIIHGDSRGIESLVDARSIDGVITSPPYPNEKDYTRTTRLESVLLGFIKNKAELQALKKTLVRSNTRSVYKDDEDYTWVANNERVQEIAAQMEARRLELGKTSGFERMYPRVTKLYFGGMARHLADLRQVLRPGAQLGYVVGDQASYLRVMIRTGQILGEIAQSLGYELVDIDLWRTRLATATKAQLREEVVLLRWPG
jgi:DNA modification methylase